MTGLVRPDLAVLEPVVHGSVAARELAQYGFTPADVLDFSVNTNPLGPAPCVLEAVADTLWTRYPGDDEAPLRQGLAAQNGLTEDQVALGNGSAELLWLIAIATLRPGDHAVVLGPTFGEYARAARAIGAQVHEVASLADLPPARVLFVCNPNNPTGTLLSQSEVERMGKSSPDMVVVLDEAYASFVEAGRWQSEPLLARYPNLVILRSLTKDHALPGLRLGYLLASPEIARAAEAVRPPWSVNAGALRAGLATLAPAARAHVEQARAVVAAARRLLTDRLSGLGYRVTPSAANFVLVEVGNGTEFRRALLPHGLVVRDATSFGLPRHVRIACRPVADCERLVDTIRQLR